MTSSVVVIPVKRLDQAKSRLASVLRDDERRALTLHLLNRTLATIRDSGVATRTIVVSSDPEVLGLAASAGAVPLRETRFGYNQALEQAREFVANGEPGATLLALATDLPLLEPTDVVTLAALASTVRAVVVAPDQHDVGTNAIGFRLSEPMPFRFGVESFRRHVAEAERLGLTVHVYRGVGTALDLDRPVDLRELDRLLAGTVGRGADTLARFVTGGRVGERDGEGRGISSCEVR